MDDYFTIIDFMFFSFVAIFTWLVDKFTQSRNNENENQQVHYYIKKSSKGKFHWKLKDIPGRSKKIDYFVHEENYERSE
jgi:hypothetical protein